MTNNINRLRELCQEFNAGAYWDNGEPSGMSKDDALEWAGQIIEQVPALLDAVEAALAWKGARTYSYDGETSARRSESDALVAAIEAFAIYQGPWSNPLILKDGKNPGQTEEMRQK